MSIAIWFWILFVIGLIFGLGLPAYRDRNWPNAGASLLLWALLFLLGWAAFGGPIKG